jgi:hypothetical protein
VDEVGRIVAVVAGAGLALWVVGSAMITVVLPRGDPVALTSLVVTMTRKGFDLWTKRADTYEERDRRMARYAPVSLGLLPVTWVALIVIGFTAVFWGLGIDPLRVAFEISGSSLFTLGFIPPTDLPTHVAAFVEAMLGLGLVALLISYLPTIYSSFQRRELLVARLATRAGDPPSPVQMILRHHALSRLDALDELWDDWEVWFTDIEETHTSQPALVFFRSISHERSWVTSAGVVLDAGAIRASTLALPRNPQAELCLRAGYLSLRRIASHYGIAFDAAPAPTDAISVTRDEFHVAYEELAAGGVPVHEDREQCWRDYAGWRVNYDTVLIALAALTMAPYAPWVSDRSIRVRRPPIARIRRRNQEGP